MNPRLKYKKGGYDWGSLRNAFILQLPDMRDDLASVGLVAEVRILGTCFVEICPKRKGS